MTQTKETPKPKSSVVGSVTTTSRRVKDDIKQKSADVSGEMNDIIIEVAERYNLSHADVLRFALRLLRERLYQDGQLIEPTKELYIHAGFSTSANFVHIEVD